MSGCRTSRMRPVHESMQEHSIPRCRTMRAEQPGTVCHSGSQDKHSASGVSARRDWRRISSRELPGPTIRSRRSELRPACRSGRRSPCRPKAMRHSIGSRFDPLLWSAQCHRYNAGSQADPAPARVRRTRRQHEPRFALRASISRPATRRTARGADRGKTARYS